MSKFLKFKRLNTDELVVINVDHIITVEPGDNGECLLSVTSDRKIVIEAEFEQLCITLENL